MKKGLLVAIEGIDGSGKTTQVELLKGYFTSKGLLWEAINFPRYAENIYGRLIKNYLLGKFGDLNEINPYFVSLAYAGDRMLAKSQIQQWLKEGRIFLANRYVSSSKAHLAANLPEEKREEFIKWLDELEYNTNAIPREELTILLSVDPKVGQQNVIGKQAPDIHESNLKHLEQAKDIYLQLANIKDNWYVVDCMKHGAMRMPDKIHQDIINVIEKHTDFF